MAGAALNRIPALFISQGIHREEIDGVGGEGLAALISAAAPGIAIVGYMDTLRWGRTNILDATAPVPAALRGASVAIGNFDGVPVATRHCSPKRNAPRLPSRPWGVITFEPHPRSFFRPSEPVFRPVAGTLEGSPPGSARGGFHAASDL